jgi:glutathione S-transferase
MELVSFELCPYVQRVAIVLDEKGLAFSRRWIDLSAKPEWFLEVSPLGKVPVLLVDGAAIFESAVICNFLDEVADPTLTSADPLVRAVERAWAEHASATLAAIGALYNAPDPDALEARCEDLRGRFRWLEQALGDGPWFSGERFGLVDAAYAPVFRYLKAFDAFSDFALLRSAPRVAAWQQRLAGRASVQRAVVADFDAKLLEFMNNRQSALGDLARARSPRRSQ